MCDHLEYQSLILRQIAITQGCDVPEEPAAVDIERVASDYLDIGDEVLWPQQEYQGIDPDDKLSSVLGAVGLGPTLDVIV